MKKLVQLIFLSFALMGFSDRAFAQRQDGNSQRDPLVRLLQTKGIITEQEAAMIGEASSPAQAERRLADLLLSKGVINRQEYDQTFLALGGASTSLDSSAPRVITASAHVSDAPVADSIRAPGKAAAKETSPVQAQAEGPMTTMSKIPVK